ncbi:hypothetical protein [Listeria welshimeri]|uniref:hypothetical protein n=1 Tax=Listeria welshimeri TaxID=1643 RepID=UPI0018897E7E|nr:hypothetical protein [Listeria welshimeri]MBF2469344.1 hypothetical protein [Listeria welshimeri]MBF2621175.1 hypothetical protein [Listeria welshimeri]
MKLTRTKRLWLILLLMITAYLLMYSVVSDRKTSHNHENTATLTKSQTTKTGDNGTITKQTITNGDSVAEQEVERSYYNTIEDAVKGSDFALEDDEESSYYNKKIIKEKVLFLESENEALLFFIGNLLEGKDHSDALVVYKFKVKKEANQTTYSNPTDATQIAAGSEKRKYEYGNKYEIQTSLNLNNAYQSFNLYPKTTQFQWGMSFNKNAPNLTINGKHPTKVIPIVLDGDDCYFWYYEDLKYDSSKKAEISFKKTK